MDNSYLYSNRLSILETCAKIQIHLIKTEKSEDKTMGNPEDNEVIDFADEEMTVELELDDGTVVNCGIVTILTVKEQDYIVLLPLNDKGQNEDGEVWFYRYSEDENDVNAEPVLDYIDDDDEYEAVAEAFDEFLDSAEFDEIVEE